MAVRSMRILCELTLPDAVIRLWDGSGGLFVDTDGNIYRPAQFTQEALQQIETAVNGEAFTLGLSLVSISNSVADYIWSYDEASPIQGSRLRVMMQMLDQFEQPEGSAEVLFTGEVDNLDVSDEASDDGIVSRVNIEVVNRFTLRTLSSGGVLSDVDQRAYARFLNPSAPDDQFCSRVTLCRDKTIRWPSWS